MHDLTLGVEAALRHFGGNKSALARALGIKRSAISQWEHVPIWPTNRVLQIEEATGGKVTRHQMRPDVFGPAPKGKRRAAA